MKRHLSSSPRNDNAFTSCLSSRSRFDDDSKQSGDYTKNETDTSSTFERSKSSDDASRSTVTTTLTELMTEDVKSSDRYTPMRNSQQSSNNSCSCSMKCTSSGDTSGGAGFMNGNLPSLLGQLDDTSLASDHGLLDVKDEKYWFDDEESDGQNASEVVDDCEEDGCHDNQDQTQDTSDDYINGKATIDLQPKLSKFCDSEGPEKEKQLRMPFESEDVENEDVSEAQSNITEATLDKNNPSLLENDQANVSNNHNNASIPDSNYLDASKPEDCYFQNESVDVENLEPLHTNKQIPILQVSTKQNETSTTQDAISYKKTMGSTSNKYIPHHLIKRYSSNYISPRQHLAHKCLQDALEMMQRNDANIAKANTSDNGGISKEELHSLTNVGCAMMLKKKERDQEKKEHDEREADETPTQECEDEQRDDKSTDRDCYGEDRGAIEVDNDADAGAPSIVSYIGTVTGSAIQMRIIDSLSSDKDASSQYLQTESESITGLSYIGTAVMHGTPLENTTALNFEDRITKVPQFDDGKKMREEDMDLMQVETTPTTDETISVESAPSQDIGIKDSQSFGSVQLTRENSDDSGSVKLAPSQDYTEENQDTLSPLPPQRSLRGNSCYSPASHANSYATSVAVSSTSTNATSDVFGLLRGAYNHVDGDDSESPESGVHSSISSLKDNSNNMPTVSSLVATKGGLSMKNSRKSMSSVHDQSKGYLTLGNALMATDIFTPPRKQKASGISTPSSMGAANSRRSDQSEFNYGSIGATFSPLRSFSQQNTRPQSVVYGPVLSPTPSLFSGYTDVRFIAEDIDSNPYESNLVKTPMKRDDMNVLAIVEGMEADSSDAYSEDDASIASDKQLPQLQRVTRLETNPDEAPNKESCAVSINEKSDAVRPSAANLTRRGNEELRDEIHDIRSQLAAAEQRLKEETELKNLANKRLKALENKLGGVNEEKELVDKCLRNEVASLRSQLAFEKIKTETAESDVRAALAAVLDLGVACEKKDDEIDELRKATKLMVERQTQLENDLVACAQGNDALRSRVIALASDGSTKEHTLITALSQLKSLSQNYYHVQKHLERERSGRQDEVTALQFSLDDMSRQMLNMSKTVNTLESENSDLRNEVKRLRAEKEQTQRMRRSARGF